MGPATLYGCRVITREPTTVTADGERLRTLPDGVVLRDLVTHVDDRGSLCELVDPRWAEIDEPLTYSYMWTIRPGVIKGWAVHEHKADRYTLLFGEVEIVLWDDREGSPTHGVVTQLFLSETRRQLLCIPAGVWHAIRGLGTRDGVLANFPTELYEHARPDKYGLPIDNDVIPFRFS
jgi:dTDP-4-dehydrorhamnose 3,5-epimerase